MGKHDMYKKRDVKKITRAAKNNRYDEESIDINSFSTPRKKNGKKQSALARFWGRRKKWQKVLIIILLVLVLIAATVFAVFQNYASKIERDDEFNELNSEELGIEYVIDKNVFNIALFGIDTRDVNGTQSNSDSIMILSVNKNDNTLRLVSIMRDSFVPMEKDGKSIYSKINAAYSYGGPANAVKTINKCFGLDISEYATVNFFGMADIIDAVGGVDCNVNYDEIHCSISINEHIRNQCSCMGISAEPYLVKEPGLLHLNGVQAVAYARIRYAKNWQGTNDDFGRTERQRYVMQQLLDKALALNVSEYPSLVNKLAPLVKTSFSNGDLLNLAAFLAKKPTMKTSRIPCDEYIINADFRPFGASSVYYNYQYAGKVLRAFLYDGVDPQDYMAQNGVDKTSWFNGGSSNKTPTNNKTTSSTPGDDDNVYIEADDPTDSSSSSSGSNTSGNTSSGESKTSSGKTSGIDSSGSGSGSSESGNTSSSDTSSKDTSSSDTSSKDTSSKDTSSTESKETSSKTSSSETAE